MTLKIDINKVREFIEKTSITTKIYIGCDSERLKVNGEWVADYARAVVIHIDGNRGCKVFGDIIREKDFDPRKDRPRMRLMSEVYKVAELYLEIADAIGDRDFEVHLDLNTSEKHGSSCVIQEAIGYIKGMCNVIPFVKPNSPAASFASDRMKEILKNQKEQMMVL